MSSLDVQKSAINTVNATVGVSTCPVCVGSGVDDISHGTLQFPHPWDGTAYATDEQVTVYYRCLACNGSGKAP